MRPAAWPKPPAREELPAPIHGNKAKPPAEHRRQRLALLMIEEAPQGKGVGLRRENANRPPEASWPRLGDRAGLGHARCQTEVEAVGRGGPPIRICGSETLSPLRKSVKQSVNSVQRASPHMGLRPTWQPRRAKGRARQCVWPFACGY